MKVIKEALYNVKDYATNPPVKEAKPCNERDLSCSTKDSFAPPR